MNRYTNGNHIEYLVDGEEIFLRIKQDIQRVDREGFIYLSFWMLDPGMTLEVAQMTQLGALISQKARQGVKIRLLIWDFFTNLAGSLLSGGSLVLRQVLRSRSNRGSLLAFLMSFLPEHVARKVFNMFLQGTHVTIDNLQQLISTLRQVPGTDIQLCASAFPDPGVTPPQRCQLLGLNLGSHHQKTIILNLPGEGEERILRSYVVGTNLHDDYLDSSSHLMEYPPGRSLRSRPWHDTGVLMEGPAAGQVEDEFIRRWNLNSSTQASLTPLAPSGLSRSTSSNISCRLLITSPSNNEVRSELATQLRNARSSVYIEDQYFFNFEMTEALIEAYLNAEIQNRSFQVCLLTNSPEEFKVSGVTLPMEIYRYINFTNLQLASCSGVLLENGSRVRRTRGTRWSLFPDTGLNKWDIPNLSIQRSDSPNKIRLRDVRYIIGGIRPAYMVSCSMPHLPLSDRSVYIHSKLTIIDDEITFIGSANYSVRSMEYDSETTMEINDVNFSAQLRERLFREVTGNQIIQQQSADRQFSYWNGLAASNLSRVRRGQVPQGTSLSLIAYPQHRPNLAHLQNALNALSSRLGFLTSSLPVLRRILPSPQSGRRGLLYLIELVFPLH